MYHRDAPLRHSVRFRICIKKLLNIYYIVLIIYSKEGKKKVVYNRYARNIRCCNTAGRNRFICVSYGLRGEFLTYTKLMVLVLTTDRLLEIQTRYNFHVSPTFTIFHLFSFSILSCSFSSSYEEDRACSLNTFSLPSAIAVLPTTQHCNS